MAKALSKEDFKNRYFEEITYDLPIKYKCKNGILVLNYVTMRDYFRFNSCSSCLQYDYKYTKKDVMFIKMKYLDYIMWLNDMQNSGKLSEKTKEKVDGIEKEIYNVEYNALVKLRVLLSMITKYKYEEIIPVQNDRCKWDMAFCKHEIIKANKIDKDCLVVVSDEDYNDTNNTRKHMELPLSFVQGKFNINDVVKVKTNIELVIEGQEFEELRHIIMFMNVNGYDSAYKSEEMKILDRKEQEIKNKKNKGEHSIDRFITNVEHEYGYRREEIYEMPCLRFFKRLEFCETKVNALTIMSTGLCGEMISYLNEPTDKYGSGVSVDSFKNKLNE